MTGHYSFILSIPLILLVIFFTKNVENHGQSTENVAHINSVLGDASYINKFGEAPGPEVPDQVRIRVHLEYVEALLRDKPVTHLTEEQIENRYHYLDLLQTYYRAGNFPYNDGHPDERRPTFISDDGNICAVGYLIEQSLGRDIAEQINKEFKYSYIRQINNPLLHQWAAESGFTMEELAMIQPMYGSYIAEERKENRNNVEPTFGAGTALLAGLNTIYLTNKNYNWIGLATGAGSIVLGALNIENSFTKIEHIDLAGICSNCPLAEITVTNHARSGVAAASIGIGAATVIVSGLNLLRNHQSNTAPNSGLDVTTIQLQHNEPIPALRYSFRF